MSDVARHAGISVGTLYSHFASKEDLLLSIAIRLLRIRWDLFSYINEKSGQTINISLWGLSVGLHRVFNSFCVSNETVFSALDEKTIYLEALHAILIGFGCKRKVSLSELQGVADRIRNKINCKQLNFRMSLD